MPRERIHFVTGKLAEFSLRRVLDALAPQAGFDYSVEVLNITVAALMTPAWVASRVHVPAATDRVILPGYCSGDLEPVQSVTSARVERGPRDLRQLPEHFGQQRRASDYGQYDIEILAEINHAPRLGLSEIVAEANQLASDGANVIDLGCNPGETWNGVAEVVRALRDAGHRVSIDSLNPDEIAPAVRAGAELVLSVNSTNRHAAPDWGCEVVAIPDAPKGMVGLEETIEFLSDRRVPLRIDPVLEPIGFGLAESVGRYIEVRRRYFDAEMMMGIGNLTELTDSDSAPINVLLLGICQELGIRSVLTTQVINWARTSVRECDLARQLVFHAVTHQTLPKHIEPRLVMLRDAKIFEHGPEGLAQLAAQIKDNNFRIFAERGHVHLINSDVHLSGSDPFEVFERLMAMRPRNVDPNHAFYLGYEMAKAVTALTLRKEYRQDEALDWGFLTKPETSHRLAHARQSATAATNGQSDPEDAV